MVQHVCFHISLSESSLAATIHRAYTQPKHGIYTIMAILTLPFDQPPRRGTKKIGGQPMKSRLLASAAAAVAVITLVSGCGAGSGTATTGGTDSNVITFGIGEPQNPLVPGNTNESNGSMVVNGMLFTGLVAT